MEKKKRGRPPKLFTAETDGMTYEGVINYNLNKQVKRELDESLADKPADTLTAEERKYLETQRENRTRTLNIRFTESEYQEIFSKCEQHGYKRKSEYVRDCIRARVPTATPQVDLSETNRQIKAIGNNINQLAIRLHSTGNFYAEDMQEIRQEVSEIWQLLLSIQSEQLLPPQSTTSRTEIRPGADYMSHLIYADPTAEVQPKISDE